MSRPRKKRALEQVHADLGHRLRDLVIRIRIALNPHHYRPGWDELTDYSRQTWTAVAQALVSAGWRPPLE